MQFANYFDHSMDFTYNQKSIFHIYICRVREFQVEWRKVKYLVCIIDKDQLEVI